MTRDQSRALAAWCIVIAAALALLALYTSPPPTRASRPVVDAIPATSAPWSGRSMLVSGTLRRPAPAPHGADGAPEPLTGTASWYRVDGLVAAAGPRLRKALGKSWRGSVVRVCARGCVTVRLTDWCQCYRGTLRERLIDLSNEAFARLDDLPVGVLRVRVQAWAIVPPQTDTE